MKYLPLLLLVALCSCANPETLDECCLERVTLDRNLADPGLTAFSFLSAFMEVDADNDDRVEGHEWHTFAQSVVAQLEASAASGRLPPMRPVTLEALRQAGVIPAAPLLKVETR